MIEGSICIIISVVFVYVGIQQRKKTSHLFAHGILVEGIVFSLEQSNLSDANQATVYPTIRFLTKDNQWITELSDIAMSKASIHENDAIQILYNPTDPKEFTINQPINKTLPYIFIALGILIFPIGVYLFNQEGQLF